MVAFRLDLFTIVYYGIDFPTERLKSGSDAIKELIIRVDEEGSVPIKN